MNAHAVQTSRGGSPAFNRRCSSTPPHCGQCRYGGSVVGTGDCRAYNPAMSILKIARMGHPVLRAKARALHPSEIRTPKIQQLIDDMFETMKEYQGVGLAAPQVHTSLRLFVAGFPPRRDDEDDLDDDREDDGEDVPLMTLINPEIEPVTRETVEDWEGC